MAGVCIDVSNICNISLQNIVDNIVGTLNATGQTASVSAHARTVVSCDL